MRCANLRHEAAALQLFTFGPGYMSRIFGCSLSSERVALRCEQRKRIRPLSSDCQGVDRTHELCFLIDHEFLSTTVARSQPGKHGKVLLLMFWAWLLSRSLSLELGYGADLLLNMRGGFGLARTILFNLLSESLAAAALQNLLYFLNLVRKLSLLDTFNAVNSTYLERPLWN